MPPTCFVMGHMTVSCNGWPFFVNLFWHGYGWWLNPPRKHPSSWTDLFHKSKTPINHQFTISQRSNCSSRQTIMHPLTINDPTMNHQLTMVHLSTISESRINATSIHHLLTMNHHLFTNFINLLTIYWTMNHHLFSNSPSIIHWSINSSANQSMNRQLSTKSSSIEIYRHHQPRSATRDPPRIKP